MESLRGKERKKEKKRKTGEEEEEIVRTTDPCVDLFIHLYIYINVCVTIISSFELPTSISAKCLPLCMTYATIPTSVLHCRWILRRSSRTALSSTATDAMIDWRGLGLELEEEDLEIFRNFFRKKEGDEWRTEMTCDPKGRATRYDTIH